MSLPCHYQSYYLLTWPGHYINVIKKDNDNISISHDEKQRESKTFIEQKRTQHEKSLNNIRIMIIKEMYILIDKEIIKLKEFIS